MKSFSQLMTNPSGVLCRLLQHSQTLNRLEKILRGSLPTPLNQHCYLANLREKTLVVYTDSSLWAIRLRLIVPDLLHGWQQNAFIPAIEKIEVKVSPSGCNNGAFPN